MTVDMQVYTHKKKRSIEHQNIHPDLTPSYECIPPEECSLVGKGEDQKCLQKQALHQEPEEVGQDTILEERHRSLTPHLRMAQDTHRPPCSLMSFACCIFLFTRP